MVYYSLLSFADAHDLSVQIIPFAAFRTCDLDVSSIPAQSELLPSRLCDVIDDACHTVDLKLVHDCVLAPTIRLVFILKRGRSPQDTNILPEVTVYFQIAPKQVVGATNMTSVNWNLNNINLSFESVK